jgi:hypothetical protein
MADEPENHTIRLLQEMRAEQAAFRSEMLREMSEMRAEQSSLRGQLTAFREEVRERFDRVERRQDQTDATLVRVIDAVTLIANRQAEQSDTLKSHGSRLNGIDSRLAIIEKHIRLVDA